MTSASTYGKVNLRLACRRLFFVVILGLTLFVLSCSDKSSEPIQTQEENWLDSAFVVISFEDDTVYWGDTVEVAFVGAASDSLQLYIHSISQEIDSVWKDASSVRHVRFTIAKNTPLGSLRLYDKYLRVATANVAFVILPRSRLAPIVDYFTPKCASPNDVLMIVGRDLPLRRKDFNVTINSIAVQVFDFDDKHLFVRLPQNVSSGRVKAVCFGKTYDLGAFQRREVGKRQFFEEKKFRSVSIWVSNVNWRSGAGVLKRGDITNSSHCDTVVINSFGDSIICAGSSAHDGFRDTIELRFKRDQNDAVSGLLKLSSKIGNIHSTIEYRIDKMQWYFLNNSYTLYATSIDLPLHLRSAVYNDPQITEFDSAEQSSEILITLNPY